MTPRDLLARQIADRACAKLRAEWKACAPPRTDAMRARDMTPKRKAARAAWQAAHRQIVNAIHREGWRNRNEPLGPRHDAHVMAWREHERHEAQVRKNRECSERAWRRREKRYQRNQGETA